MPPVRTKHTAFWGCKGAPFELESFVFCGGLGEVVSLCVTVPTGNSASEAGHNAGSTSWTAKSD